MDSVNQDGINLLQWRCKKGGFWRETALLKLDSPQQQQRALPIPDHSNQSGCRAGRVRGAVNGSTNSKVPKTKPTLMATDEATVARIPLGTTAASGYSKRIRGKVFRLWVPVHSRQRRYQKMPTRKTASTPPARPVRTKKRFQHE